MTERSSNNILQIREKMGGQVYVEGLSSFFVKSVEDLQNIIIKGDENRKTS